MSGYNLTSSQQNALKWIVENTQTGTLKENEVLLSVSSRGIVAVQSDRDNIEFPREISESTLDILNRERLVHLRRSRKGSLFMTLHGNAYEAVKNQFSSPEKEAADQIVFNLQGDLKGDNNRINIHSEDRSVNIVNKTSEEIYAELRSLIQSNFDSIKNREVLLESVRNMEKADSKSRFLKAYSSFVSLAADHVSLFEPFFLALLQLSKVF